MTGLRSLTLTGTPYERGVRHGEAFAGAVRENRDVYLDRFETHGLPREAAREQAAEYVPVFEEYHEGFAEEMRGIADGADLPLEEVALINARYELIYGAFSAEAEGDAEAAEATADDCTSFGVQPEVTADGRTYVGQNWDWIEPITENVFAMDVRREDGPDLVALTEAGIATGRKGVNEHGVGFVANGLVTPRDGEHPFRKPYMVRCREILDAERLDQAVGAVVAEDRVCSTNFLIGHESGEMIDIEAAPETANYLYPEDGILTHANHFEGGGVESEFEKLIPHTLCRAPRMERLLTRQSGDLDGDALEAALRDHVGRPNSICRHVDEDEPPEKATHTIASLILDLGGRRMLATRGPPCESDYRAFEVGA